jgi:hypothetical protein
MSTEHNVQRTSSPYRRCRRTNSSDVLRRLSRAPRPLSSMQTHIEVWRHALRDGIELPTSSLDHTDVFANAFRTSDCEIPNCRAIRDGVTPALNAARTAFTFPCVKGAATASTRRLRGLSSATGSFLPRRFCSATTAETNRSNSRSSRCLIAFDRSAGKTCGGAAVALVVTGADELGVANVSRVDVSENKSGAGDRDLTLPMCG